MDRFPMVSLVSGVLAIGCGQPADPMEMDSEGADSTGSTGSSAGTPTSTTAPNTAADTIESGPDSGDSTETGQTSEGSSTGEPPLGRCPPIPTRMVVLGDSITACAVVGGKDSDDCSPKRLNDHLAATLGPISYENLAVGGSITVDIPNNQLDDIDVGMPGHVLVVIYVGGNDLSPYIIQSDQAALDGWNNTTGPEVAQAWEDILTFLGDAGNFPDGVTLLMNTQYNPFDDCTAPPYFVSEVKIGLLHAHNDALVERAASEPWAFIADQHPSYLGHGHYVNDAGCPYYDPTFEGWMGDLIHPNAPGHHHLADMMVEVVDQQIWANCE